MGAAEHDNDHVLSGILCRIGSGLSFSTMGALFKLASLDGFSAPELVFYRSLFSLPVVLLWVLNRESLDALRPNRPLAHVWRSSLGLLSMGLTFQALVLLPLADATAINFTAPIFATILSFLILREDVRIHRWAAVAIGFIGVLMVVRPGGSSLSAIGVAIALIAAIGQAGVTTTLRHLQRSENVVSIVFWFGVAGGGVGALMMPFFAHARPVTAFVLVIAGGFAGGVGQLLMTTSLRAPVSVVSAFDYLQIVTATVYGWLLFSDVPKVTTVLGAALIAVSGIYTAWREHRRKVRQAATAVPAV